MSALVIDVAPADRGDCEDAVALPRGQGHSQRQWLKPQPARAAA
jgi:hypothetical protein